MSTKIHQGDKSQELSAPSASSPLNALASELSGRELDAAVAERVMDWRWMRLGAHLIRAGSTYGRMLRPPEAEADEFVREHMEVADLSDPLYEHGENILYPYPDEWLAAVPAYSTDIAAAMEVEARLYEMAEHDPNLLTRYSDELMETVAEDNGKVIPHDFWLIHATASQRSRAALAAMENNSDTKTVSASLASGKG